MQRSPLLPWSRSRQLVLSLLVMLLSFLGLRLLLGEPRFLTSQEVEAARGGVHLVESVYRPEGDGAEKLSKRLFEGFQVSDQSQWWGQFKPIRARQAGLEPALPRWIAGLGIGVLPSSEEASNFERASIAATLVMALVLLLLWLLLVPHGPWWAALGCGLLASMPGFWEAASSAGYGAAGLLAAIVFAWGQTRFLQDRGGVWLSGLGLALLLAVHPMTASLAVAVFVSFAIVFWAQSPSTESGRVALPMAPLGLFGMLAIAVACLFVLWPSLWEVPRALGIWIVEFGQRAEPWQWVWTERMPQAPAWIVLVQLFAWIPLPVLLLASLGVSTAIFKGRKGQWWPIVSALTLLLTASFNGGLFAGGLSLLPVLWVFVALTALEGARAMWTYLDGEWRSKLLIAMAVLLTLSFWQGLSGRPLVTGTGSESLGEIPTQLLQTLEEADISVAERDGALGVVLKEALELLDYRVEVLSKDAAQAQLSYTAEQNPNEEYRALFEVWREGGAMLMVHELPAPKPSRR